jgi:hypothetical protein
MSAEALPTHPSGDEFFAYSKHVADPVRGDLVSAHRRAWRRVAGPGTWWTGAERVAIAAASRTALGCSHCQKRKAALSPMTVEGEHDAKGADGLPSAAVDAVHRIVTDATRLSKTWIESLASQGVSDAHYVELLSVVVSVRSIDSFHRAMGLEPEVLPVPAPGEPSRVRPREAVLDDAFVPLLPPRCPSPKYEDLYPGPMAPFVIRAMSLVPDAVRWLKDLSSAHYLSMESGEMMNFGESDRPLSRAQTELIAGRVSAVNECFY